MFTRIQVMACPFTVWQGAGPTAPLPGEITRLLVVHSDSSGHLCGCPQGEGVTQALADGGRVSARNPELRFVHYC